MDDLVKEHPEFPRKILAYINIQSFEKRPDSTLSPNNCTTKITTVQMDAKNKEDAENKIEKFLEDIKKCRV